MIDNVSLPQEEEGFRRWTILLLSMLVIVLVSGSLVKMYLENDFIAQNFTEKGRIYDLNDGELWQMWQGKPPEPYTSPMRKCKYCSQIEKAKAISFEPQVDSQRKEIFARMQLVRENTLGEILIASAIAGFIVWAIAFWIYRKLLFSSRSIFTFERTQALFSSNALTISTDASSGRVVISFIGQLYEMDASDIHISVYEITKAVSGGTTYSSATGYASNGQAVTVSVPTGYTPGYLKGTGKYEITISQCNGGDKSNCSRLFMIVRNMEFAMAIEEMGVLIKQIGKEANDAKVNEIIEKIAVEAGVSKGYWFMSDHINGKLTELLMADTSGAGVAVYDEGKMEWRGSWKNAVAKALINGLEVKVDDPDYRKQHLTERRFVVFKHATREQLMEWHDRITILSKS